MSFPTKVETTILDYQMTCLKSENDFLSETLEDLKAQLAYERSLPLSKRARTAFSTYARNTPFIYVMQLYWTITRVVGLGHLHDGSHSKIASDEDQSSSSDRVETSLLPVDVAEAQCEPRVLIDVGHTAYSKRETGIQRVVREFASEAYRSGRGLPIIIRNGKAFGAYGNQPSPAPLELVSSDILFLADSNWESNDDLYPFIQHAKSSGVKVVALFYDIIPYLYPYTCDTSTVVLFKRWFDYIVPRADAFVTTSQAVAEELRQLVGDFGYIPPPIGWTPVGTDLREASGDVSEAVKAIFTGSVPVFISVGTLEPRKAYPIALEAFEQLWRTDAQARYVIVGRCGWGMGNFEKRLLEHPLLGTSLFWLDDASDGDLVHCYKNAAALIMPSIAEGFGVPLVEAAQFGLPIVASDMAIFREVAKDTSARFFRTCDPNDLADVLQILIAEGSGPKIPNPSSFATWSQSVGAAMDMIRHDTYQLQNEPVPDPKWIGPISLS